MKKKPLQLSDQEARRLYKTATPEWKEVLENNYGKEFFNQNIIDRIDGWEDMLAETGRPDVPEFSDVPEDLRPFFKGVYENVVMVEAYNEGEKMDIYNSDKPRYYPYFRTNGSPSSFAFYVSDCVCSGASAGSGSRLALKDQALSDHVGTKHIDIWRKIIEL